MSVTAPVVSVTRGSFHDGDGVRTVVYLKGCSMRCLWCHNPESLSPLPELLFTDLKCIGCGICAQVCPEHHMIAEGRVIYRREGCTACGRCADACPVRALEICGCPRSPEDLFSELRKDSHYYESSGGGVTFSGGECLLYPEFVAETAKLCHDNGIHTAAETALQVPWEYMKTVLPYIDLFLVDIKHMDGEEHKKYTGCDNTRILENLTRLAGRHADILLRVPLIPTVNDSPENLSSTVRFAASLGSSIRGVELLKYNPLARSKYTMTGLHYQSFGDEPQNDRMMEELCSPLRKHSPRDGFVFFTK